MRKVPNKFDDQEEWPKWVGKKIYKHSGKPFANKEKIVRVKALTSNPFSGKQAFRIDGDSIVDCYQCKLYSKTFLELYVGFFTSIIDKFKLR